MAKVLLQYALNNVGTLVSISDAQRKELYICPICKNNVIPKLGKIRERHYSHKRGENNTCGETLLHELFKKKIYEHIQGKLSNETTLKCKWRCGECNELHCLDILKDVKTVKLEYNLGAVRPDVALLDGNNKLIAVIEVIVSHKPSEHSLKYYRDNGVLCLQYCINTFNDVGKYEYKLCNPDNVNICYCLPCVKCNISNQEVRLLLFEVDIPKVNTSCYKCQKEKICVIVNKEDVLLGLYDEYDISIQDTIVGEVGYKIHKCPDGSRLCYNGIKKYYDENMGKIFCEKILLHKICEDCKFNNSRIEESVCFI